jgi:ribosomal protein S18 acetylase RimI-like enzyme
MEETQEEVEQLHPFELRDANAGDLPFLFSLYCDVRSPEVNAWGWAASQRDAFLRMQFDAQRRSYQAAYPQATHHIVCSGSVPIGRRLVAAAPEEVRLVDIALLSAYRNCGIGTRLIQQLVDESAAGGVALSLQVLRGNPAQRLYERLGFIETGADAMYITMQLTAGAGRCP